MLQRIILALCMLGAFIVQPAAAQLYPIIAPPASGGVSAPIDANMRALGWRQCATRTYMPNNNLTGAGRWQMTRSYHVSRGCEGGQIVACFMAGKVANNVETQYSGGTIKVGLEYPIGATPVAANENIAAGNAVVAWPSSTPPLANPSMTVPAGYTCLSWNASIPDGQPFAFRPLIAGTNVPFKFYQSDATSGTTFNEGWESGTGAVSDKTTSGTFANNTITYGPTTILARTTRPAILIYGDSTEEAGDGYISDKSGDVGPTALAVGRVYGYTSFAQAAQTLNGFLAASRTMRDGVVPFFTHIVDRWGINDIGTGRTVAQLVADRATFASLYPSATVIGVTMLPYITTTDGFKSTGGQNVLNGNNVKVMAFNALARAGIAGEKYLWDYADAIDPGRLGVYPVQRNLFAANDLNTATVTGSIPAGSTTLTVSSVTAGTLKVGDPLVSSLNGTVGNGTLDNSMTIVAQLTGTAGGVGTYQLARAQSTAVTNATISVGGFCSRDGLHPTQVCMEIITNSGRVNLGTIRINRVDYRDLPRMPANDNGVRAETMAG